MTLSERNNYSFKHPMIDRIKTLAIATAVLISPLGGEISASDRVAIKAFATDEYTVARARDDSKKIQTYFIAEGKYYPGNTARPGMKEVTFMEIAQDLAFNLKRQNFFSEINKDKGDLLILVHYGVTDYDPDYMEERSIDSIDDFGFGVVENDDPLLVSAVREEFQAQLFDMQTTNEGNSQGLGLKARLLGMDKLFSSNATDQQINELREMLEEERYFIVLNAFDLPLFRKGEKKLVWSTRYSIRAGGKKFDQAIAELNVVAGEYFGKNFKGLNLKRASDKSNVEMGNVEVLDGKNTN
jgi:hypothetical protein